MQVNNESSFQSWVTKNLFSCMAGEGIVVRSDSNNRNGVSDVTWIVPDAGIMAIELKYSKSKSETSKLLQHKLSTLQARFLESWDSSSDHNHGLVFVGTEDNDLLVFSGENVHMMHVNEMSVQDAKKACDIILYDIVGSGFNKLQSRHKDLTLLMDFMGIR